MNTARKTLRVPITQALEGVFGKPSGQSSQYSEYSLDERPDPDITRDAIAAISPQLPISFENIKITVRDGWSDCSSGVCASPD
jgi:hypothetical protein